MKHLLSLMSLGLALGVASVSANAAAPAETTCYREACVGDRAINVSRDYREVTILGIDNLGKFVLRFEDNGGVGGNWDRDDLALERGCTGDLCVGYPAINVSRDYRRVKVAALHTNGKFVLRFDDNNGVGGNWDRSDLAVAWGCVGSLCVNDTVYNKSNGRQAAVAAIQAGNRMVLDYGAAGLGGNWEESDLVLLQRGPTAYPPTPPTPLCPPGTHWDPRVNACVGNVPPPPPPPPYCPPGTHWDPRIGRCVANPPPPPPPAQWTCTIAHPGRVYTGHGPTQIAATQAVLLNCHERGDVCRAAEAVCRR